MHNIIALIVATIISFILFCLSGPKKYVGGEQTKTSFKQDIDMNERLNDDERAELNNKLPYYEKIYDIPAENQLPYRTGVFLAKNLTPSDKLSREDAQNLPKHRSDICISHLGQRKLLLNEIEFISMYDHLSDVIVYAGACPGIHIYYMAKVLFPDKTFNLYDPRTEWHEPLRTLSNVNINTQLFTDEDAKSYDGKNVLFICDIRTWQNKDDLDEWDKEIEDNMNMQMRWVKIMNPSMASLKFRLPWNTADVKVEYLAGDIYNQPFQPPKSTESRLYTDGKSMTTYSSRDYEQKCYRHNVITRIFHKYTAKDINAPEISYYGLDDCYDCARQLAILHKYVKNKKDKTAPEEEQIIRILKDMDLYLDKPLAISHLNRNNCHI
jgi:hypothetical protein